MTIVHKPIGRTRQREDVDHRTSCPSSSTRPSTFSMLTFPVAATSESLQAFEETNKIHVFVFGWKESEGTATRVYPRTARKVNENWKEVVLMLHQKHYSWVKNFNALMALPKRHRYAALVSPLRVKLPHKYRWHC